MLSFQCLWLHFLVIFVFMVINICNLLVPMSFTADKRNHYMLRNATVYSTSTILCIAILFFSCDEKCFGYLWFVFLLQRWFIVCISDLHVHGDKVSWKMWFVIHHCILALSYLRLSARLYSKFIPPALSEQLGWNAIAAIPIENRHTTKISALFFFNVHFFSPTAEIFQNVFIF